MTMLRHTALYMVSSAGTAILGFTSTAVLTRLFTPADYGVYLVANGIGAIVSATLFTWVRLSVLRLESRGEESDTRATAFGCYAGSALLLLPLFPLLALGLGLPWRESVGACLFAGSIALFELELEILRANKRVTHYVSASLARAASLLALGVVFHALGFGGFGLTLSLMLAYLGVSAALAPAVFRRPIAHFDLVLARSMLAFGIPATLSALSLALHSVTDRLVVTYLMGGAAGGQYGVAADFTRQLILVPTTALASAIVPAAIASYAAGGVEAARRHLVEGGELLLALLLPAVVGLALVGHDLAMLVLGEKFRDEAAMLIPILSFIWLFQALSQSYVHVSFHISGRSRGMVIQSAISLAANFVLIVPATLRFGITGAASAVLIAEAVGLVAGFPLARPGFALPVDIGRIARVAGATGCMALAVLAVGRLGLAPGALALAAKVLPGGLAYLAGVLLFGVGGSHRRLSLAWRTRTLSLAARRS